MQDVEIQNLLMTLKEYRPLLKVGISLRRLPRFESEYSRGWAGDKGSREIKEM